MEIPKKKIIFPKMELSYISGNGNPKKVLLFQEVKSFLHFGNGKKFFYARITTDFLIERTFQI